MKIAWIRIKGFQQFEDVFIDFRHPETGKPLDKICFIGRNGTGKSTLLELLKNFLLTNHPQYYAKDIQLNIGFFSLEKHIGSRFSFENKRFILFDIEEQTPINREYIDTMNERFSLSFMNGVFINENIVINNLISDLDFLISEKIIFIPSEISNNLLYSIKDVPVTTLNAAMNYNDKLPYTEVSNATITGFWNHLIYQIKKRESDRSDFEELPENGNKTKNELKEEFEKLNPDILVEIATLWNEILEKAGLRFDYENAKKPIQLTENLQAYIVNKHNETIGYSKLSTGIRNFIFRFGHLKSLYFNKEVNNAFLFVDEPENSLFPDFLLNIIEKYQQVTTDKRGQNNTQMFFATHSPLIAAQFEPYERVILDWDENGSVKTFSGTAPIGDDPNDILNQDFGMNEVVSKKGQEVWEHYLALKKLLRKTENPAKKEELVSEISKIGREYNFAE